MLGDVALHEGAPVRVQPAAREASGCEPGVRAQLGGVLRNGDRVQVHNHVEGVMGFLQCHPLADRTKSSCRVETSLRWAGFRERAREDDQRAMSSFSQVSLAAWGQV